MKDKARRGGREEKEKGEQGDNVGDLLFSSFLDPSRMAGRSCRLLSRQFGGTRDGLLGHILKRKRRAVRAVKLAYSQ